MKSNPILLLATFLLGISNLQAQQKTNLSLHDAVAMALEKNSEVGLARTKAITKSLEMQSVKNNQYPDFKISGQYLRLTNAAVDLKTSSNNGNSSASPQVNQLILGQANLNLPLFSGFKIQNSIQASESLYQAEMAKTSYTKEETAMQIVQHYADLYKAQKAVELLKESLKSGQQRVFDFTAAEQNGIIARNDLLKTQLQVAKIQLTLDEAEKNVKLINFYLITLLKLAPETQIEVNPSNIDPNLFSNTIQPEKEAIANRKDLQALNFQEKASASYVKVAKSGYYPSLNLVAGYTALSLQNVVTVENAMNFGIGVSYNLSSIFKNGKEVKVAQSKMLEVQQQKEILTDAIKMEILKANEEYELSLKQDKVYKEAVVQATENYRIVKDKYDNGLSETKELLDADVEQLSSKINLAYAKANVALKYYELLNASGQLIQSFNLTKN